MKNQIVCLMAFLAMSVFSGCGVRTIARLSPQRVRDIRLESVSLRRSCLEVSLDMANGSAKDVTIYSIELESADIRGLKVSLSQPVTLHPGTGEVRVPVAVDYSFGSFLSILENLNGDDRHFRISATVVLSSGNGRRKTFHMTKNVSEKQIKSLISRIKR